MKDRFPHARAKVPDVPAGTALVAYAYLVKTLAFGETFDRSREPLVFHSGNRSVKIASFGFRRDSEPQHEHEAALERQVKILSYHSVDDFVLELKTKSQQDNLILAKIRPAPPWPRQLPLSANGSKSDPRTRWTPSGIAGKNRWRSHYSTSTCVASMPRSSASLSKRTT